MVLGNTFRFQLFVATVWEMIARHNKMSHKMIYKKKEVASLQVTFE